MVVKLNVVFVVGKNDCRLNLPTWIGINAVYLLLNHGLVSTLTFPLFACDFYYARHMLDKILEIIFIHFY